MSWLVFDLHGSVAAICPAGSTTLSDAYRYDGWGNQVASAGSVINPYRYRGLLNLANDTGAGALLAMGAREYSPQLGTFTQEDSVAGSAANPASMNRFLYALANPATLIDPDGHMAEKLGGGESGSGLPPPPQIEDCTRSCVDLLNTGGTNTYGGGDGRFVPPGEDPAPEGWHWSSVPFATGKYVLLADACSLNDPRYADGECANTALRKDADTLAVWVLSVTEGAVVSREWVSELGRCLKMCVDATAKSKAGRMLRAAGAATAFGRSALYKRFAGKLPLIGLGVEVGLNMAEGQDVLEASLRAGGSAAGSVAATSVVAGICGFGGLLTGGVAAAGCFLFAAAAAWAGGTAGDELGGEIYDIVDGS